MSPRRLAVINRRSLACSRSLSPCRIPLRQSRMDLLEKISHEDRELVKRSWVVLTKNLNDLAYNIFEMIFNQSPDTKQLFPFMKFNQNGRSREIEFHGLRFMQVLESVVAAIDRPASLDPLCDNLGRIHGRLAESRGFKAHHWGVFIECTLFHFRKTLNNDNYFHPIAILDRSIIVWRTILRVLIKRMKKGLDTDLRNRQANRVNDDMACNSSENSVTSPIHELNGITLTHSVTLPVITTIHNVKGVEKEPKLLARQQSHPADGESGKPPIPKLFQKKNQLASSGPYATLLGGSSCTARPVINDRRNNRRKSEQKFTLDID